MEVVKYSNGVATVNGIPILEDIGHAAGEIIRGTVDLVTDVKRKIGGGGGGGGVQYVPRPLDDISGQGHGSVSPWLVGGLALGAGLIALIALKD